jgi:hypothetical protein
MHGMVPKDLDLSLPAMSILGLSRVAYRRRGESVEDILQVDPPIQSDVVKAISYKKFEDYYRFVELFLAEEFPGKYFPECENCGASSIVNNRCEAALSLWNPLPVTRATWKSYYQNTGDSKVKLKSYVLLAVRKSLPDNSLQADRYKRRLSFTLATHRLGGQDKWILLRAREREMV